MRRTRVLWLTSAVVAAAWTLRPQPVAAHCDTLDGPVAQAARQALDQAELAPVRKWIRETDEPEVAALLAEAVTMRDLGPRAQAIGERLFLETVVRLHRAGEGAPFTGLKPAGEIEPLIRLADSALEQGNDEVLIAQTSELVAQRLHERFGAALERRAHADDSPEAGRDYVRSYIELTHTLEGIAQLLKDPQHGLEQPASAHAAHAE